MVENERIKTFIIAGDLSQFLGWCRDRKINPRDKDIVYLSEGRVLELLQGHRGKYRLRIVGTWYNRQDQADIQEARYYLRMIGEQVE